MDSRWHQWVPTYSEPVHEQLVLALTIAPKSTSDMYSLPINSTTLHGKDSLRPTSAKDLE